MMDLRLGKLIRSMWFKIDTKLITGHYDIGRRPHKLEGPNMNLKRACLENEESMEQHLCDCYHSKKLDSSILVIGQ